MRYPTLHKMQAANRWHGSCFQYNRATVGKRMLTVQIENIGEIAVIECEPLKCEGPARLAGYGYLG
jgi:hypothetical protein